MNLAVMRVSKMTSKEFHKERLANGLGRNWLTRVISNMEDSITINSYFVEIHRIHDVYILFALTRERTQFYVDTFPDASICDLVDRIEELNSVS